jgi:hypothetical protein
MGTALTVYYQIMSSSNNDIGQLMTEKEANFVMRKIIWAVTSDTWTTIDTSTPSELTLSKTGLTLIFDYDSTDKNIRLQTNTGTPIPLTSSSSPVTSLIFKKENSSLITTFTMNGQNFQLTKLLR